MALEPIAMGLIMIFLEKLFGSVGRVSGLEAADLGGTVGGDCGAVGGVWAGWVYYWAVAVLGAVGQFSAAGAE